MLLKLISCFLFIRCMAQFENRFSITFHFGARSLVNLPAYNLQPTFLQPITFTPAEISINN